MDKTYEYKKDGKEIWITTPEPQRRYDNMIYNDTYFMMIDQSGNGVARHMTGDGYENVTVANERILFVRDDESGESFSIGFAPLYKDYESYACGQGLNYQIIENTTNGIKATWRMFVPLGSDPVEIWDVRLEDISGKNRKLSLFSCMEMPISGVDTYGGDIYRIAAYDADAEAIFVRGDAETFNKIDFPLHNAFVTASETPVSWDANYDAFIGKRRTIQNPIGLENGTLSGSHASKDKTNGGLHFSFEVAAGDAAEIRFVAGACETITDVQKLKSTYIAGSLGSCEFFQALETERADKLSMLSVETGVETVDTMINAWALQQNHYLSTWCRWGWMGYRDIVQMSQGVLYWDRELARKNLKKALEHQYADGFALRGWNPLDPMRYADCASWNVYAITEYVKETGDFDFLDEVVSYYDEGEASVYDHLMQLMNRLLEDRGDHGMCLAFFGDWNDSLTGVCRKGKGESVWLTMAFCRCALVLKELAGQLGKTDDVQRMEKWHAEVAAAVNANAWDGKWYICALDDEGEPIGSEQNEEGKIYLNMQSWAQLGGICTDERWDSALESSYKHLDSGWGMMLNWPTYTKPAPNIGRLSYLRPGICENGSVYTHGNAFFYMALLERGLADEALKVWEDIHPANENRPVANQPNVFANGYFGPDNDTMPGMSEHIWTTGSAPWMVSCTVEHMIGLRRGYDGLLIEPCLPTEWGTVKVSREYRGSVYNVTIEKEKGVAQGEIQSITVNGNDHEIGTPLPLDGGSHEVVVDLRSSSDVLNQELEQKEVCCG